jgi:hypothetical protein
MTTQMRRLTTMIGFAAMALIEACSSTVARVGPPAPTTYQELGPAHGSGCGVLLLHLIPIGVNDRTERAYKDALAHGGSQLVDTKLRAHWYFIGIGDLLCTSVEGTAIQ